MALLNCRGHMPNLLGVQACPAMLASARLGLRRACVPLPSSTSRCTSHSIQMFRGRRFMCKLQGAKFQGPAASTTQDQIPKQHLPLLVTVAPTWFLLIFSELLHHISRLLPANQGAVAATLSILLSVDLEKANQFLSSHPLLQNLQPLLLCTNLRLLSVTCNVHLDTAAQMAAACPLLLATRPRALQSRLKLYAKVLSTEPTSSGIIALMQCLPCMLLICPKTMALRCANLVSIMKMPSNSALEILQLEPRLLLLAVNVIRDKVKLLSKEFGSGTSAAVVLKAAPRILLQKTSVLEKRLAVLKDAFQGRLGKSITAWPQALSIQGSQLRDRLSVMRSMAGAKGMKVLGPSHMRVLQLPANNIRKNFNALEEVFGSAAGELVVQEPLLLMFERSRLKAVLDKFVIQLAVPWTRLLAIVRQNPRMLLYTPVKARQLLQSFADQTRMSYSDASHLAEAVPGLLWPRKEQYLAPDEVVRLVLEKKNKLARAAATNPTWQRQLCRCKPSTLAAMLLMQPEDYERLEYLVAKQLQDTVRLDRALLMRNLDFSRRFPDYPLWWEQKQSLCLQAPTISFKAAFGLMFLSLASGGPCCSGSTARLLLPPHAGLVAEQSSDFVRVEGDVRWWDGDEEELN